MTSPYRLRLRLSKFMDTVSKTKGLCIARGMASVTSWALFLATGRQPCKRPVAFMDPDFCTFGFVLAAHEVVASHCLPCKRYRSSCKDCQTRQIDILPFRNFVKTYAWATNKIRTSLHSGGSRKWQPNQGEWPDHADCFSMACRGRVTWIPLLVMSSWLNS